MDAKARSTEYVFSFHDGDGKDKQRLGGKGANLCEMTQMGLNVPPGFVISTQACLAFLDAKDKRLPEGLMTTIKSQMQALEKETGKGFGDAEQPLLVSVRSGSAMSMPGMMDTILNLGLNTSTLEGVIKQTGDARFAYDAYRRFIQLFGKVALNIPDQAFDSQFEEVKQHVGIKDDVSLRADHLKDISERFLEVVQQHTGQPFPEDPYAQLEIAVKAVFNSWRGKRAVDYRQEFHITPEMANGTAVNIVTMVFGNRGNDSATGVAFTRNPATGENKLFGEYLLNAQGEDVVAGIRTPKPIQQLADEMPDLYQQLETLRANLENHYKEIQDFEFTIEKGKLYCLQTRNGKMNTTAMVRSSVEMEQAGLIDRRQALLRIEPHSLEQMLYPGLDHSQLKSSPLAQGLSASPGAACGHIVFDADRAETLGKQGQRVILVRDETKPEDIHGFFASQGILTSRGGKTSHAAVVARGMGKPCVAGAEGIHVDVELREAHIGDTVLHEGDLITIDGSSGNVYLGEMPMMEVKFSQQLETLLQWADEAARLKVMANADTVEDAQRALKYGAMGIGLCRTERMFNAAERLPLVIEMIVAENKQQRQQALDRLLPIQRSDFQGLFETMAPHQVTIRLLDPPIHEFLPSEQQLLSDLDELKHLYSIVRGMQVMIDAAAQVNPASNEENNSPIPKPMGERIFADPRNVAETISKKEAMLKKVRTLHEVNPMLGHRGVRLGITFPEIYCMQI
ncbi:MAG: pyruvate, phosphate dikinase, partial [Gammaproteobacteria bacterium]|nr:pyruvate, phosphate dikinase [Gammaproteobacteria bacterium]